MIATFVMQLGHGRALEFVLGWLKTNIAISFIVSDLAFRVPATADLVWNYPRIYLVLPLLVVGLAQVAGVMLNIAGYESSWKLRAGAASLAIVMWSMALLKTGLVGEASLLIPIAVTLLPASTFLFFKAWNRLPVPGAAGLT